MSGFRIPITRLLLGVACLLASSLAGAQDLKVGQVQIGHPYARSTSVGQSVGSAYLSLRSTGVADRLLSAKTPLAAAVELHSMSMQGDVMRMRQIDSVELPAGQTTELKPGGLHMMLTGLKGPLKVGSRFPMTLVFEKAGSVEVEFKVEAPGAVEHKH